MNNRSNRRRQDREDKKSKKKLEKFKNLQQKTIIENTETEFDKKSQELLRNGWMISNFIAVNNEDDLFLIAVFHKN